ncbi:MAG: hypothetical protein Q9224_000713 [Gallowayella concinna]
MPDFVWSTERSPFMTKMREHILPFEYTKLKNFKFDMSTGIQEENDIVPPPQWTNMTIPFNYSYRQKSAVQRIPSATGPTVPNSQRPQRNGIPMVPCDIPAVPTKPPDDVPPEISLPEPCRTFLAAVREILIQRPICTRRYLQNQVNSEIWKAVGPNAAKNMYQYVGFIWNSGPWRDSICAFGVDPRKHKEMRWYQTVMFQLEPEPGDTRIDNAKPSKTKVDRELTAQGKNPHGHVFDGRTVGLDGKVWQLADITDPLLKSLLETNTLRDDCHQLSDGWYTNGTMAKVRVVMKAKLEMILAGSGDDMVQNDELSQLCQRIPDVLTLENRRETIFSNASKRLMALAEQLRAKATRPDGARLGAWGHATTHQNPRVKLGKGVKGVVTFKQPGGRPKGLNKQNKPKIGDAARAVERVMDTRLKDAKASLEEAERQATMKAFEDVSDGREEGSDDDDNMESEGEEVEEIDEEEEEIEEENEDREEGTLDFDARRKS